MKDNKTIAQIYREMHLINEGLSPNVSKAAKALQIEIQKETNVAKKMKMADDVMKVILGEEAAMSLYGKETPGQEKRIDLAIDGVPGVGGEIKKQQPLLGSGIKEDQDLDPQSIAELEIKRADRSVIITKDGQKKMKPKAEIAVEEEQIAAESTDAYGKSVQQIADKKKKDAMSTSDKQKLGAVADLMKRANEQNEIEEVKVPANYAQMMAKKKKKLSRMTSNEKQADAAQKSKRNKSTENTMQEEQMPTGVQVKHIDKKTGQIHATQLFTARDAMQHEKDLKKAGHKIHSRAAVYGTKVGPERLMSK